MSSCSYCIGVLSSSTYLKGSMVFYELASYGCFIAVYIACLYYLYCIVSCSSNPVGLRRCSLVPSGKRFNSYPLSVELGLVTLHLLVISLSRQFQVSQVQSPQPQCVDWPVASVSSNVRLGRKTT
uniref:Uncharacterized protein n=1 Tax=Utricularia reniformis TaxID=192314 RepID=A0A1Y0B017_9LAMI|nr:hypothetical protein AEK19_MT0471 [Utricularia reniformis]ART30729.1 hypothetical protein AEK19_MT0471 [Utricularia reniformis]